MNAQPAKPSAGKDKGKAPGKPAVNEDPVALAKAAVERQKKERPKRSFAHMLLLTSFIVAAVVFVPTTVMVFIGMLPTVASAMTDRSKEKMRAMCVGFMNFGGCFPFWVELVKAGHTMEASLSIVTQPMTIVVMYAAAAAGYMIDWALSGVVAGIVAARARDRLKKIQELQKEIVDRWGVEVTGEIPLDKFGFAVNDHAEKGGDKDKAIKPPSPS